MLSWFFWLTYAYVTLYIQEAQREDANGGQPTEKDA